MAVVHEFGEPVNTGEREVLRRLRDDLPDDWQVVANFEFPQNPRWFECDALALSPNGWGYLVETKAWLGQIEGNDAQWRLPPVAGDSPTYRKNPVQMVTTRTKQLASYVADLVPTARSTFLAPLLVLASASQPKLEGKCRQFTVTMDDMVARLATDPREEYQRRPDRQPPANSHIAIAEALSRHVRRISPDATLGPYRLIEQLESSDLADVWLAEAAAVQGSRYRLKRFYLDPYLVGEAAEQQRRLVRRDLEALMDLQETDGAVPLVGNVQEIDNSFIVATLVPNGESLESMFLSNKFADFDDSDLQGIIREMVTTVARIHEHGVVHRTLGPSNMYLRPDFRVQVADFDYSRLPGKPGVTAFVRDLDGQLTAPEVTVDPSKASMASDVYSLAKTVEALLRSARPDTENPLSALPESWEDVFNRSLGSDPSGRPESAVQLLTLLDDRPQTGAAELLQVGDTIDDRYVVRKRIEHGGLAVVFRVYDVNLECLYAAKFVRTEFRTAVSLRDEYLRLDGIPQHPQLIRGVFLATMSRFSRNQQQFSCGDEFLLTKWIDGDPLSTLVTQHLPVTRIIEIGIDVASALEHLHRQGIIHRDVKPENVIVQAEDRRARLLDLNISVAADKADRTLIGTLNYRPTDFDKWNERADTYALGVTLTEVLAGERLGAGSRAWLEKRRESASGAEALLLTVLLRATAPIASADLIETAAELGQALGAALPTARESARGTQPKDPPQLHPAGPNCNPYVETLTGIFSQSSTSNAGTRGLDEFAEWAYVSTAVDEELFPAIRRGDLRLVLITGNAGDGKTAFLRMVESRLREEGATIEKQWENGSQVRLGGTRYVTNWDGSQDEQQVSNDEVLKSFFAPFSGDHAKPPSDLVAIIAINEGRLLDFLIDNRDSFGQLRTAVEDLLAGRESSATWLTLVNLNLRALPINKDGRSVVKGLIRSFSDSRLWDSCNACAIKQDCYARANAAMFRDPLVGERAIERIRELLDTVRLRRRMHITMRDLSSFIAYTITANRTCSEIIELKDESRLPDLLMGHAYNAVFAAGQAGQYDTRGAENDRLLREVAELDVAATADPEEDMRLWTLGGECFPPDPDGLEREDRALIEELRKATLESPADSASWHGLRLAHASLRRKLFMEREDPGYVRMLPYRYLRDYRNLFEDIDESDRVRIAESISRSEGLQPSLAKNVVAVRLVEDLGATDRTFVTRDFREFGIEPLDLSAAAAFVEYEPDVIRYRHLETVGLELDIDVDVYEALMRMRDGFVPSREDLRGAWLNLQAFKDRLASIPSDRLLLAPAAGPLVEITVDYAGRIEAGAK